MKVEEIIYFDSCYFHYYIYIYKTQKKWEFK